MAAHKQTYRTWAAMKSRCQNPRHADFARYGGRGIKVCAAWQKYECFLADMGEKPDGMSLERIDNDGNYEPGNCRWATMQEQAENRSNNQLLTAPDGRVYTQTEVARMLGITPAAVHYRMKSGSDVFAPRKAHWMPRTKHWDKTY